MTKLAESKNTRIEEMPFKYGDAQEAPFKDFEDYCQRGIKLYLAPMIVHVQHKGGPDIIVPAADPDYERPSISEIENASGATPDQNIFDRIVILDHLHPLQHWQDQSAGDSHARIWSESDRPGSVVFYRPDLSNFFDKLMFEWFAALYDNSSDLHSLFVMVDKERFELPGFENVDTDRKKWAVLGQQMFCASEATAFLICTANPLRSAIVARASADWITAMDSYADGSNSFASRAELLDYSASSWALKVLENGYADPRLLKFMKSQRQLNA